MYRKTMMRKRVDNLPVQATIIGLIKACVNPRLGLYYLFKGGMATLGGNPINMEKQKKKYNKKQTQTKTLTGRRPC